MNETLKRLYDTANDLQLSILDELTVKAGLIWECDCRWRNVEHADVCDQCGQGRPVPMSTAASSLKKE